MSEPKATAESVEEALPGLWRWSVHDERIDFLGSAYAIGGEHGTVLVDPLPLAPEALASLGQATAIVLTSGSHQRSAWRLRRELGTPVWAPELAREIEEEPDERYGDGDELPGGLRAVFTPGAGTTQHTLLRGGEPGVAFVPDLLLQPPGQPVMLVPAEYVQDPAEQHRSVEKLLELPFEVLCLTHGGVLREGAKGAVRAAADA
ncbi:MAG: MBL fold metallo-hydrolase [Gaiellaceae bacterium]